MGREPCQRTGCGLLWCISWLPEGLLALVALTGGGRGGRTLCEDGAQRDRVRRHAAHLRGLPPDERRPGHGAQGDGRGESRAMGGERCSGEKALLVTVSPSSFFFPWSFWWPGWTQPNLREALSNRTIKSDSQSLSQKFPETLGVIVSPTQGP